LVVLHALFPISQVPPTRQPSTQRKRTRVSLLQSSHLTSAIARSTGSDCQASVFQLRGLRIGSSQASGGRVYRSNTRRQTSAGGCVFAVIPPPPILYRATASKLNKAARMPPNIYARSIMKPSMRRRKSYRYRQVRWHSQTRIQLGLTNRQYLMNSIGIR
ncbi:hypothetical protein DM02DRAFT_708671, partial [Periconia macrospinosa]